MALTLLAIIRAVQAELGLPQSTTVIGSSDATTIQMLALANRCLDELRRCNPTGWTDLQFEYDLVVPVPLLTTGDLLTANTPTINNIPNTSAIKANYFYVSGTSIPQGARVKQVVDANTVTLNMDAVNTAVVHTAPLTFAQDTFPEPPGLDWLQNQTMWDRTNHWTLLGPSSPQFDQYFNSGITNTGPRRHFRQLGPYANSFRIWPPPLELTAPLQLVFEYLSMYAVVVDGGAPVPPATPTFAQYFANDDDSVLLDEQALIMGIKWMFWEAKGMGSYVTFQNRWLDYVDRLIARDGAAPILQMNKTLGSTLISPANVQDGSFPGPDGPNTG